MGGRLRAALQPLVGGSVVGDVRGRGLLVGVENVVDHATREPAAPPARLAQRVFEAAMEEGVIVYPCAGTLPDGRGDQILLTPPCIIRPEEIDEMAGRLTRAIATAVASLPPGTARS